MLNDEGDLRFRQVIDASRDAFIEVDAQSFITEWSREAEVLLGWSREEMISRPIVDIVKQDFSTAIVHDVGELVNSASNGDTHVHHPITVPENSDRMLVEMEMIHRDGSMILARGVVFATAVGGEYRIGGFVYDAKKEEAIKPEELTLGLLHDQLTGLPGRELFMRRISAALENLKVTKGSIAIVVLDLDRFKAINDTMGHDAGDELLIMLVSRLRSAGSDSGPVLARLGGDEFLALFECEDGNARAESEQFVKQAFATLKNPFEVGGTEVFISVTAGVTATDDPDIDPGYLLSNADAAMHQSKYEGGGAYKVFGEAMRKDVFDRMTTEHSLHRALDRKELRLFYQPVVEISQSSSGVSKDSELIEAVGVEALIRWQHPEQGLVAPDRFIPVAEESGLIIPIGAWVLEEACEQLKTWRNGGNSGGSGIMEVNLSARQIDHPDIVPTVERILEATGLPPENLTLEITESALMRNALNALEVLQALKSIGVSLAIDDFGTGYSSLSYLQRFPLDVLKVDKSFVDELQFDQGTEIVAAVVNLAHALGLHVVAEGVETEQQLSVLRELKCDYAQGYYFSRPVPAHDLMKNFALSV